MSLISERKKSDPSKRLHRHADHVRTRQMHPHRLLLTSTAVSSPVYLHGWHTSWYTFFSSPSAVVGINFLYVASLYVQRGSLSCVFHVQ